MNLHFDPETEKRIAAEVERRVAARLAEGDKLQQKLEHLASFPDFNPNPVIEIDTHGEVTYCNRPAREMIRRLEMPPREAAALLAGDPDESCATDGPSAGTHARQHEVRIKDRSFSVSCHFIKARGLVRIYAHDITDRRRAGEALQESEERYRTLFENMTEGFALGEAIDDGQGRPCDFRFIEINPAFERQSGLSREILGKPMTEVLPHLEQHWIDDYCGVAHTGESIRFEQYNRDTGRHYEVSCFSPARAGSPSSSGMSPTAGGQRKP